VTLMTSTGWSIAGRVSTESGEAPSAARERFRIVGRLSNGDAAPVGGLGGPGGDGGRVRDDWTFALGNLYGPARVRVTMPDDWVVKAILQEGRDIADSEIEAHTGETISNVQVIVSNRGSSVAGQLVDGKGAPSADGTVIIFAEDAQKWSEDSRFVRSARPD